MLDVRRIKSSALKRFARGDPRGINAQWHPRVRRILFALNAATLPTDLNTPGSGFHELKGDRKGTYSWIVTGNYRLTFKFEDGEALEVDLEDYH